MILYPAIDIRDGRAVRLVQGDYDRETAFDADPVDAAMRWVEHGAEALHVVDLDGAREGAPVNVEQVVRVCEAVPVAVQVGGGLREAGDVAAAFDAGAARVVLGTAALADPALLEALVEDHGERIVVSADTRGDRVAIEGWERKSAIGAAQLVSSLSERGVRRFIYTPVEVDGTLEGPRLDGLRAVAAAAADSGVELVYSGGVGELEHLRALATERLPALTGVIVGRALYEGRFTVEEGREALRAAGPTP